jgi:dephospho-CoA kinase
MRTRSVPHLAAGFLAALFFVGLLASSADAQRARRAPAAAKPDKRAVVFVCLPGSGKSFASERLARRVGAAKPLVSGDVIREAIGRTRSKKEQAERALVVSREFAARQGEVGRRVARKVASEPGELVIVEGFRTPADLAAFKKAHPNTVVVSVDVPTGLRHERMLSRGRSGEDNRAYLRKRDREERKLGLGQVMKEADVRLRLRSNDVKELDRQLDRVIQNVGQSSGHSARPASSSRRR